MSGAAEATHGADTTTATSVRALAAAAKVASRELAPLSASRRNSALEALAHAVEAAGKELLQANLDDVRAAEGLSLATRARLQLDETKLREMADQMRSVKALSDPLGRTLDAVELDNAEGGLHMQKMSVPLGVLAVIFEARPDAVTQIAALALKSGNAVILKPGREVERTATVLVRVLREALEREALPSAAITMVLGRESVAELLGMHDLVDMVIPRGAKELVDYVQNNTRIPVLGHAEGVCHIYVDRAADEALALRVIDDAKTDYPAACNAVETVLVHREIAAEFVPRLAMLLREHSVKLFGDETVRILARDFAVAAVEDWHMEYGELALSIGVVESLEAAIEHIHRFGSAHTEAIMTDDLKTAERFLNEVDAASVMHNASTRFADGFRYGFGAEVGISTSKLHARGPVGLEGLTTYKYVVRGHGHVAADYRASKSPGKDARMFTHKREQR
jgi:glutamate-5-semialdehyde dehydrogenase